MTLTTCAGPKTSISGPRTTGPTLCDDYWRAHAALASREICCDDQPPEKKTDCEPPPPPWFSSADCRDLQDPVVEQTRNSVTIYLCGYKIFSANNLNRANSNLYREELRRALQQGVPRKVCCNRFRDAARTGRPCDVRADVDCDGTPNNADRIGAGLPSISGHGYTIDEAAIPNYDLFPPGMSEDEIMPPAEQCRGCKWELTKGVLRCSPDGTTPHQYTATWRCRSTGEQTERTHRARASAPCTLPPSRQTSRE